MAGQQPMHVACSAHGVAAQHVDGLVQVVLHLVLLCGQGTRVRGWAAGTLPSPSGPALATEPRGVHWTPFPTNRLLALFSWKVRLPYRSSTAL